MYEPQKSRTPILLLVLVGICAVGLMFSGTDASSSKSSSSFPPGFSTWDGSHTELVRAIKGRMNDPSSFEHVETRYDDSQSEIRVIMKYRGKNGFGGTVTQYATGIAAADGRLIRIVD